MSSENGDTSNSNPLGKLIPKRMRSKLQRKRDAEMRASEEIERGRSVADRGTLVDNEEDIGYESRDLAVPNFGHGDGSSLMTFESEVE